MRNILILGLKLLVIALIAGLALGVVNAITEGPIKEQARIAADLARTTVLPEAKSFTLVEGETPIYEGYDEAGQLVGYTLAGVTKGYGGMIEVTVGMDTNGVITGVEVGGSSFKETAGLGEKTKSDPNFRAQYVGMTGPVALKKDGGTIDAVSSATISSRAVTNQVEALRQELAGYMGGDN